MEFKNISHIKFYRFLGSDIDRNGIEVYHLDESVHIDKDDIISTEGR